MGFLAGGDLFLLVVGGGANALSGAADTVFTRKATWFLLHSKRC